MIGITSLRRHDLPVDWERRVQYQESAGERKGTRVPDEGRCLARSGSRPGRKALFAPSICRRPGPSDVVVETLFSGISRGTETLVFQHRVPPSQYAAMRCPFQEGEFPAPVKYGYSAVGRVVDGPDELLDRIVFVLHPHQTRFVVPASAAVPIPPEVPPGRAVLAANMETALNGLWDAEVMAGDRVCVIGAGVVGLLTGWLASAPPASRCC